MATIITDVTELQAMENDLAGDYELGNDIDASATSGWNGGLGFAPISEFIGTFNGRNHTISGLYINRPAENSVGLFATTDTATIRNIELTSLNINGDDNVGGLTGYLLRGSVDNVNTSGVINANGSAGGIFGKNLYCTITNSHSSCVVTGGDKAGGIGGFLMDVASCTEALMKYCYATGNIAATNNPNGTYNHAGGCLGHTQSAIVEQCYATGNVIAEGKLTQPYHRISVGGFVGDMEGSTPICRDCYGRGQVNLTNTGTDHTGDLCAGFIGRTGGAGTSALVENCYSTGLVVLAAGKGFCALNTAGSTISDCFWDTETSEKAASDGGTGKTTSEMKTKATFTDATWDFIVIWGILATINDGYPFLWALLSEEPESPRSILAVQDKITLESIRNIEMSARGRFRVDKDGNAVYRSRYARNA